MGKIASYRDILELEKTPFASRNLPADIYEYLCRSAAAHPDTYALRFLWDGNDYRESLDWRYSEFLGEVHRAANLFHSLGVGKTDVVSYLLPNLPQTYFTLLGGQTAGIVNPVNPLLEPQQIAEILRAAGTRVLVTLAPFPRVDIWEKVEAIRRDIPTLTTILQVDLLPFLSGFRKILARLVRRRTNSSGPQQILDFDRECARFDADDLTFERDVKPDDIAAYFHTGGTTGTPKLAMHTHGGKSYDLWAATRFLKVVAGDVFFGGLPLFHVAGEMANTYVPLSAGATLVNGSPQGFRGDGILANFWEIVEHYRVTYFTGVPTVFSKLLDVPIGRTNVTSLKFALCSAAPLPVEVFKTFEKRTGIRILEGYGLTEATCVCAANPPDGERRVGSVGLRFPYQEMKAIRLDIEGQYERDCDVDEIGLVIVRGRNLFAGYKDSFHNKHAWIDTADGKGRWLNTGDMGRRDADGFFWLTGRMKELIIRGGHNIDPQQIEGPMHLHPDVEFAAAVGRPHDQLGEVPVLYVKLREGATVDADALMEFAEKNILERAAIPKGIRIVDNLPQTAVGKIFKPALRIEEIRDELQKAAMALKEVASAEVTVVPDKLHGFTADVTIAAAGKADPAALDEKLDHLFGSYPVHTRWKILPV